MAGNRGLRARQVRRFEQHLRGTCPDHKCLVHLTPELLALADLLISHYGHGEQDEEKWLPSRSKTANAVSGTIRNFPQWAAEIEAAPQQDKRVVTTSQGIGNGPPEPGEGSALDRPSQENPHFANMTQQPPRRLLRGLPLLWHKRLQARMDMTKQSMLLPIPLTAPAVPALSMGSVQLADAETGANKAGAVVRQTGPYPPGYLNFLALKTKAKRRGGQDD
ncbi:hypothetical protein AUP68_10046 [Ilyonectria robusta]